MMMIAEFFIGGLMALLINKSQDQMKARQRLSPWWSDLQAAAARHRVSTHLLVGLFWTESRCNPDAVGSAGEVGLGQMRPIAAEDIGVDFDRLKNDPVAQIDAAAAYLGLMLDRSGGDLFLAIRAYNAGLHHARKDPSQSIIYLGNVYTMALTDYFSDVLS